MAKMKLNFSNLLLRSSLSDPIEKALWLGLAIEFVTDDWWVVALNVRTGIPASELSSFDDLSRSVAENASDVLRADINRILPFARREGDVLARLSAENPWSLTVTSPAPVEVTIDDRASELTVEKIAENYILTLIRRAMQPKEPFLVPIRELFSARSDYESTCDIQVPPAWTLPSQVIKAYRHS